MSTVATERSHHLSSEKVVMVARQPIYNSHMGVFGYELLFRSPQGHNQALKPTEATAQVLSTTILQFGLDKFVHNRKVIVNVTPAFIEVIQDMQLPPKQVILDIPDNLAVDERLIAKLKELRRMGYGLSIGGMNNLKDQRLLPLASIFRIDVQKVDVNRLDALIKFLRRFNGLALQALKIETMEEFRSYRDKGFDYMQGFFLGRPHVYVSRDLCSNKLAILQLLTTVNNPDTPTEDLEQQISRDMSLSYKLIKLVNAPFFGVAREVESIKQAIVFLGREEIRKWVSILALGGLGDGPAAAMEVGLFRAKMCELLAEKAGLPIDSYFTVGMFSALDILMTQPIKNILAQLPLSEAVKAAILDRQGDMGRALTCALAMENAKWAEIGFANLGHDELSELYYQAVQWTDNMIGHL